MKQAFICIGIFVALLGIGVVSYIDIDSTKAYSMSFNDMKSVKGGETMYEDYRCVTQSGGCVMGGCNDFGIRNCEPYQPGNVCIDFDGGEQTCSGPGDCYHYTDDSGCTSYPE